MHWGQRLIVATEHVGHGSVIIARTSIYRYLVSLGVVLQSSVPTCVGSMCLCVYLWGVISFVIRLLCLSVPLEALCYVRDSMC